MVGKFFITRSRYISAFVLVFLFLFITSAVFAVVKHAEKNHHRENKVHGAQGTFTWTDPNLNNGDGSYHRVGIYRNAVITPEKYKPFRFIEYGWAKETAGYRHILIFYNDATGELVRIRYYHFSPATYEFRLERGINSAGLNVHFIYVNGVLLTNIAKDWSGISKGDGAIAGGEVLSGVENMGGTEQYGLFVRLKNPGTDTFYWWLWNYNTIYNLNSPYYFVDVTPYDFLTYP